MSYHVYRTLKYMGSAVQEYQLSEAGCEAFDFVSLMSFFFFPQIVTSSTARDF